jgi:predicted RNA-binding protein YlqC (UPF0109 family)
MSALSQKLGSTKRTRPPDSARIVVISGTEGRKNRSKVNHVADQTPILGEKENIAAMSALVSGLVGCLVDKPSAVSVQAVTKGDLTSLQVRVDPEDVDKLVGKQGRMTRSLRTILSAASMRLKQRFSLDILDERSNY